MLVSEISKINKHARWNKAVLYEFGDFTRVSCKNYVDTFLALLDHLKLRANQTAPSVNKYYENEVILEEQKLPLEY